MGLQIHKQFFENRSEVYADLDASGMWPTTFVSGPSPGLEVHWHAHDVHAYVIEGDTDFLDVASGERLPVGPGDKIVVPARTLHAEGAVKERVVYILAAPEALPTDEFLVLHSPSELEASRAGS